MIQMGDFNTLKVARKVDFGYYLDGNTGEFSGDILLPNKNALDRKLEVGDVVEAFIYRDSKDRPVATLSKPLAKVGDLAYLEVVSVTKIGAFVSIGLERDVFVPMRESKYPLFEGKKYLFYIYVDKTDRIAATTDIDRYLELSETHKVGDEVEGVVYGKQTNDSLMVAIENKYKGVILHNEYFSNFYPGDSLKLRVKKKYETGILGVTPRQGKLYERDILEDKILEYLKKNKGFMPFNDKSNPEDIKAVFHTSKNYFKIALGGLMKKKLIRQTEKGTELI